MAHGTEKFKGKTLFVRNLSYETTDEKLTQAFEDYGPIKMGFVVKDPVTSKSRGLGYIIFSLLEDAEKACNGVKSIDGRRVIISHADPNRKKNTRKQKGPENSEPKVDDTPMLKEKGGKVEAVPLVQESKKQRAKQDTEHKVIVRNLSFKCDEDNLKKAFKAFGNIIEAKIPTMENGKKYGYGIVRFKTKKEGQKAVDAMNAKSIMGRQVAVDWLIAREKYQQANPKKKQEDKTNKDDDDSDSEEEEEEEGEQNGEKEGEESETSASEAEVESEVEDDEDEEDSESEMDQSSDEEEEDMDQSSDEEEGEEEDESDSEDESSDEMEETKKKNKKKFPARPSDVAEGKTLFIRNVSFDSEEEDVEEFFAKFGEIASCRLVIDPETEHSKGMAFVKFANKEDADKCILHADNEQLNPGGHVLNGRRLLVKLAIPKEEARKMLEDKEKEKQTKQKDSRNLWLLREGLIRAGTEAAIGLQKSDLKRREEIERTKRQKLKNPETFVSPQRLCVHNLPTSVQDAGLRKIFLKAADNKNARITECRIMRDLKRLNASGVGKSRGYAFLAFDNHEHALAALRGTNNNPNLFGEKKRPIVEFSVENRAALQTKQLRLERSKAKLQMLQKERPPRKGPGGKISVATVQPPPKGANIPKGMPSHMGPKIRHKKRGDAQQKKQQKKKPDQKPKATKRPAVKSTEEPSKKKKKRNNAPKTDDLDRLIAKHRMTFQRNPMIKSKKWFDT